MLLCLMTLTNIGNVSFFRNALRRKISFSKSTQNLYNPKIVSKFVATKEFEDEV